MVNLIKAVSPEELIKRGAPKLFTTSAKAWKEKLVTWFETHPDGPQRKLFPAQLEQVLIDMLAYGFSLLGKEAQLASEQRWLLFQEGAHLDVGAANNSTYRLKAAPATCLVRATLEAPSSETVFVGEKGTALVLGDVTFELDSEIVIPAGSLFADGGATATEPGPEANGIAPGLVKKTIGNVEIANTTETVGGADDEGTEPFRYRALNAHDRISKAGGRESYRQQARAFSPAIVSVAVIKPQAGFIDVHPLLFDGLPTADFRSQLKTWLEPLVKRPQGDELTIRDPEAVTFTITGTARAEGDLSEAKARTEAALEAAASIWSRNLGDYMALSALTCAARSVDGLVDVDLTFSGLASRQLEEHQFAVLTGVSLTMEAV
ncbi:baseplate J/gp47 family protein [Labrenzia sp. R4_2]|uniref:baseplate J/gp47 family protein n=1 Tax=Labrenzia sp. R4_2 TaxID=2821107 RepID=UPI001ADD5DA8|nr:baseplate J/gp47 family protein [Labrenzia sp. R4_2]MBO9421696.1 baseplate J/gp47 family protein [Labrenzia sp. R4_2]